MDSVDIAYVWGGSFVLVSEERFPSVARGCVYFYPHNLDELRRFRQNSWCTYTVMTTDIVDKKVVYLAQKERWAVCDLCCNTPPWKT